MRYLIIRNDEVFETEKLEPQDYIEAREGNILIISPHKTVYRDGEWIKVNKWEDNKLF